MKTLLSLFFLVLIPSLTHAYILRTKTVLERVAKTRGEGLYTLQFEVVFKNDVETLAITENWIVLNGEKMFLEARGSGFRFVHIYNERNKYQLDDSGVEVTRKMTEEFAEPWFHYRSTGSLGSALAKAEILPMGVWAKDPVTKDAKGNFTYSSEPHLRLGRTQGIIAYAFGQATPPDSTKPLPGAWFEQDRFFLRKLRFPTSDEITADEYSEYAKGLWFPAQRNISWGTNRVTIRVLKISNFANATSIAEKLTPNYIRVQKPENIRPQYGTSNLAPMVREFYSRFR